MVEDCATPVVAFVILSDFRMTLIVRSDGVPREMEYSHAFSALSFPQASEVTRRI